MDASEKAIPATKTDKSDVHIRRKRVQRLIEEVHLHQYAPRRDHREHIRARVRELVVALQRELDRDAEALDGHHGDRAGERAYRDVDERVGAPVPRGDVVDHDEAEDEHGEAVHHEPCA